MGIAGRIGIPLLMGKWDQRIPLCVSLRSDPQPLCRLPCP